MLLGQQLIHQFFSKEEVMLVVDEFSGFPRNSNAALSPGLVVHIPEWEVQPKAKVLCNFLCRYSATLDVRSFHWKKKFSLHGT